MAAWIKGPYSLNESALVGSVITSAATTGIAFQLIAGSLTSGNGVNFGSENSAFASSQGILRLRAGHAGNTGVVLKVEQQGAGHASGALFVFNSSSSTTPSIGISNAGSGDCIACTSTTGALRVPSMTTAQKGAIGNAAGRIVFDTTLGKLCVNTGAAWETITSA